MERNFLFKTKSALNILDKNGFKLTQTPIQQDPELQIIETNHYLGLFVDRSLNYTVNQYVINRALESQGIVIYMPTYIPTDSQGKSNIAFHRKQSKQMVLRIHVQHKSPLALEVNSNNEKSRKSDPNTWHHAIFENQLRLPPPLSQLHLPYIEWFKVFRLSDWTLVDYDGVMKGNRLLKIDQKDAS